MQGLTSIDPRWEAIHPDGTPFPSETHPTMLTIKTAQLIYDVVMGIKNTQFHRIVWIKINSIPVFKTDTTEIDYVYAIFEWHQHY